MKTDRMATHLARRISLVSIVSLLSAGLALGCYSIPPGAGTGEESQGDAASGLESHQTPDSGSGANNQTGGLDAGSLDAAAYSSTSWTGIYLAYMAGSTTLGHCAASSCHAANAAAGGVICDTPASCYSALQGHGQISGTSSAIASTSNSILAFVNPFGAMPYDQLDGDAGSEAAAAITAWVAAGAPND